jgi:GntR family transcriptional regulator/MocR family aminotransferase
MSGSRTTTDRDLLLELRPGRGCRAALEDGLREAIRDGRLAAGSALPSTRVLARDLGIARSTVSEAYAQLTAAGYLTARQGAGTWVASAAAARPPRESEPPAAPRLRFDLRPGVPDLSSFPRLPWERALRRALRSAPADVFAPGDPSGRPELRGALAAYLARARGVLVTPGRLVICNGFSQGLKLVYDVLRARGARRVAIEDPSLWLFPPIAEAARLEPVPVPVDEEGIAVDELDRLDVEAVVVTPAHQFPLGATMSSRRRTALLDWAARRDAFVIEDDYDGEFRYDRHPIGALQGLDPDRVVYAGTAAKTLAPGIRLAWLGLPPALTPAALQTRSIADRYAGVLDQLALAELLESGDFDRHVRRMRRSYRRRRDMLIKSLTESAPRIPIRGTEAGLHALLELSDGSQEEELLRRAAERSLGLHGLRAYLHGAGESPGALVVGYGTPADHAFPGALDALVALLRTT